MHRSASVLDSLSVSISSAADGACVVALAGELDIATVTDARDALREARGAACDQIVLDMTELRFMDLRGLRLVLRAKQRLGVRLRLPGSASQVHRLLELTGVDEVLAD